MLLQKHNGTAQCTLAQNCRKNHLQTFAHKKRRTQKCEEEKNNYKHLHKKGEHTEMQKNQLETSRQLRVRDLFAQILPKLLLLLHIFHCRSLSVQ